MGTNTNTNTRIAAISEEFPSWADVTLADLAGTKPAPIPWIL